MENSSDSSSGRRPDSKSDEFLIIFILGTEMRRCECTTFPIHRYTYWDFKSNVIVKGASSKLACTISPSQPSTAVPPSSRPVEIQK